jgi:FtsP/CotA-like multicopper oxidase with cupredoxin domain
MRILALAAASVLLASCASAPLCGHGVRAAGFGLSWPFGESANALSEPPEVSAVHGVVTVALEAVRDANGAPAFAYAGTIGIAPTIRVRPGERIELTLHNALPPGGMHANVNIHVHGLAVSPKAPGDDSIGMLAHPGETVRYSISIPRDHEPGLYWYHPHAHGATFEQVAAGMSGAIVIEGIERVFPAVHSMRERILLVRDVPVRAHVMAGGASPAPIVDDDNEGGDPCRPDLGFRTEINGNARPSISIAPGEQQFFRVVNASAQRSFDLSIEGVALQLLALDGVPLSAYPRNAATRIVSHVTLPPASRAEFVVTGPRRRAELRTACVDTGPSGDAQPAGVLADLGAPGAPDSGTPYHPEPRPPAVAFRSGGLPRNALSSPIPRPAARRTIRLTEDARHFYINGKTFDPAGAPAITARAGTVEEWTILNDTEEAHAFHVHQVHVLVERIDGAKPSETEWLDVVSVPSRTHYYGGATSPGSAKLLVDFRDPVIRGVFLYHCHILDHEDRGMMAKIAVL